MRITFLSLTLILSIQLYAQIIPVGSGSYTKTFPGHDEAGRNGVPPGSAQVSGAAVGKPIPTNDWWSKLLIENHADNLFNYPMTMKTTSEGLIVTYIPNGVIGDNQAIVVGVSGLNASRTTVSDYSDWTVTMDWIGEFKTTSGIGMPFLYFEKGTSEVAQIKVNSGSVTLSGEMLLITDASSGADFAVYVPAGSSWVQSGSTYTSTLNGKNYWSMAMLPQTASNPSVIATEYKKYAYVFPTNTTAEWTYNEASSVMRTDFTVETSIKEGAHSNVLQGLLPHQWGHLASNSQTPDAHSYSSVRGEIKTMDGNTFSVENTFHGILPTLPYLANYSDGFSVSALNEKVDLLKNEALATWTDSYNEGQVMNRLVQTARIADEMGNIEARDQMITTVRERLEDWFSAESSEVAFLFHYNENWTALLGYPAGHGQDNNINDHHFHWGYFIHAAAFIEQIKPGWATQWGAMVDLLVRDAASSDRDDSLFPYLRNFSPYAGHCWANGFASFPQGNDQESTSESMQFNSSLIHWGTITRNDAIRDLGIYLYTTEQSAVEEYWLDINERIFPESQYSLVSRVWGNSYDNGTFWTSDIEASYGIELYPIHGGSMYLGHNTDYAEKLWTEIEGNTGILSNDDNVNLWHDIMYQFLAFTNPEKAIGLYNSNPDRNLKFGVSDAQTYYWIHAMNAMGRVDATITSNYPTAVAFEKEGVYTYAVHNYSETDIDVTFSNGFVLAARARQMTTNRDVDITGSISSSFKSAYPGGSVDLTVIANGGTPTKVEFFDDGTLLGEDASEPYTWKASELGAGIHGLYAKVYSGEVFGVTNISSVVVGDQQPYSNTPSAIPGIIEAGHYDKFQGGKGQGIAYVDTSPGNNGDFRTDEDMDAERSTTEGETLGWIAGGEWVEYTVMVNESGLYDLSFRFASGNQSGGGLFHLELNDLPISQDISLGYTNDWNSWQTKTVSDLPLPKGEHVLRLVFDNGEFNLARMTFTYSEALSYSHPVADAGANVTIMLPATTSTLDGSQSSDPTNDPLTYQWSQVYGPSIIAFSDDKIASPSVSNLEEGVYKCHLEISDGQYQSSDDVLIVVSTTGNSAPSVTLASPISNASFKEGATVSISATATDLEGDVTKVEFYAGSTKLGEDLTAPFSYDWIGAAVGNHQLTAQATDASGAMSTSQVVSISVNEVKSCKETSSVASEGAFSIGYKVTFESSGSNVTVTFELLDTDKAGVVAFLWQQNPFSETQMDHSTGTIFTKTLTSLIPGSNLRVACKFAFAGGLAVTKYLDYQVGADCDGMADVSAPTNFTTTVGDISMSSVELLLNATDDSGAVIYEVKYESKTKTVSAISGVQEVFTINALTPETTYSFAITAKDLAGNTATNGPISLNATTTANTNTPCMGTDFLAQDGAFDIGYTYSFETTGTDVKITFELLDNRNGVLAFLWKQTPFAETAMSNVSGQTFTQTITGQTIGTSIRYGCKFAFAGGQAVTKYFSYEVGDDCQSNTVQVLSSDSTIPSDLNVYPNPVNDILTIDWDKFQSATLFGLSGQELLVADKHQINMTGLSRGLYLLVLREQNNHLVRLRIMKN